MRAVFIWLMLWGCNFVASAGVPALKNVAAADGAAWQNRKKIISCAWEWGNASAEDILRFQPQIPTSGVDARPGEIYAARLKARRHGGFASAVVRFQNEKGWHYYLPSVAVPLAAPDPDGWEKGAAVVPVPRGATKLVLLLNVRQRKEDSCEFSDVEVFRIF